MSNLKELEKEMNKQGKALTMVILKGKCTSKMLDDYEKISKEYQKENKSSDKDIEYFNTKMKKLRSMIKINQE